MGRVDEGQDIRYRGVIRFEGPCFAPTEGIAICIQG